LKRNETHKSQNLRLCVACRQVKPREELVRVTFDFRTGALALNIKKGTQEERSSHLLGRSAYFCPQEKCFESVINTTKLKAAIEGRKKKGVSGHRRLTWPLEAQLIEALRFECSNRAKTCQNTEGYGED